jgi:hypothetical protein
MSTPKDKALSPIAIRDAENEKLRQQLPAALQQWKAALEVMSLNTQIMGGTCKTSSPSCLCAFV